MCNCKGRHKNIHTKIQFANLRIRISEVITFCTFLKRKLLISVNQSSYWPTRLDILFDYFINEILSKM